MDRKPRIGIGMNYRLTESGAERAYLDAAYLKWISGGGAIPVPVAPTDDRDQIDVVLKGVDGVFFTGGLDLHSSLWGEALHSKVELVHPYRQAFDFLLYDRTLFKGLPILAVCLGMQMIQAAHGGGLHQHLPDREGEGLIDHGGDGRITEHEVRIDLESKLYDWLGEEQTSVNSAHHQGILQVGDGLVAAAVSQDGVVEAMEGAGESFLLAVQWHPERDAGRRVNRVILERFIEASIKNTKS